MATSNQSPPQATTLQRLNFFNIRRNLTMYTLELLEYFPVYALLVHFLVVLEIPDCGEFAASTSAVAAFNAYVVVSLVLTFIFHIIYLYPEGAKPSGADWVWMIWKSLLTTANLFAWMYVRKKPFQCGDSNYNSDLAQVLYIGMNLMVLLHAFIFQCVIPPESAVPALGAAATAVDASKNSGGQTKLSSPSLADSAAENPESLPAQENGTGGVFVNDPENVGEDPASAAAAAITGESLDNDDNGEK